MEKSFVPKSNWDGQLPHHIAKNEQIWWEVVPRIRPHLPPKITRLFGGAKESPSREIIGKVVLIADTKGDLGTARGSLLNDWGCYCQHKLDGLDMVYMAGTATEPHLIFSCPFALFSAVGLRFGGRVDRQLNLSEVELEKLDQSMKDTLKEDDSLEECRVSIQKFQRGSWENGLDIAFKAAIWLNSNREEALANIWKGMFS